MAPVVEADGVEKRYGETVALAGVSLSIDAGEIFGLIGPNGAGKTTLVRAITGTAPPDAGTVTLLGAHPERTDAAAIGVLPQSFSPPARLSARELLTYYASLYPTARDPETVLEAVGLEAAGDTWYENLSGGQQRRLCVGSTLLNDPDVLVLDEPTTGIDPAGRRTIWRLIEGLADDGTTVLLTTHDMAEAERLADRVGLLADGVVLDSGPPDELIREHAAQSRLTVDLADSKPGKRDDTSPSTGRGADVEGELDDRLPYRTTRHGSRLVVYDVEPTAIGSVVDVLVDVGVEYSGLSWDEASLEDVYLELAGGGEGSGAGGGAGPSGRLERPADESRPPATDGGIDLDDGFDPDAPTDREWSPVGVADEIGTRSRAARSSTGGGES